MQTPLQFYVLRVVLGFAEGGLAPGIVLYLSQFATERERATTFALPMLAIPLSIVFGGPLSGWLMGMGWRCGFAGWRWMLRMIERLELYSAIASTFSTESITLATSSSRTGAPLRHAITIGLKRAAVGAARLVSRM